MFSKNVFYLLMTLLLFTGCKKDNIEFSVEPKIEIVSISPATPTQYLDPVTITIKYEDGDGDLGENNDVIKNCFVTDNRVGITYEYRIKQLGPTGASIPITGNVNIDIGGQVLTDSSAQQSVSYTLYVIDRAGHKSNIVTTTSISIMR